MSKLTGVFERFPNLEKMPLENVNKWLKGKINLYSLQNYLGNLILYPQAIPTTKDDLSIELAILKEAARLNSQLFYDLKLNNLVIPMEFVQRFPPLLKLVTVLLEVIDLGEIVKVMILDEKKLFTVGTIYTPQNLKTADTVKLLIDGKLKTIKLGTRDVIHTTQSEVSLKIDDLIDIKVWGGSLGIIIDLKKAVVT